MIRSRTKSLPLKQVKIQDQFFDKYTKLVTKEIIPYQWKALNDQVKDAEPSHCIKNFQIAAGLIKGEYEGAVFQDTDLAKWLEAVAYSLSYEPDAALEAQADAMVDLIGKAQQEDGYLDTYFIIKEPNKKFCNLREGHELYTAGHFMEAAVAYYEVTGKEHFLHIMCRVADLICKVFHEEKYKQAVPGHQEIEIGLFKLYQTTKEKKYLQMAKEFIDRRGSKPNYLEEESKNENWIDIFKDPNPFFPEYSQSHKPVRLQDTAEGHAVRAVYMYSAMADIAYEYKDEELLKACEKLYDNITKRRMYITGGIGSSGAYERFTTDYDLPNDSAYAESCASIGLALFCRRMLQITGEEKYADTMECALMNTVAAGIALDGKKFFYVNPLEVWPENCMPHTSMAHVKPIRQKWFGCACCPPNIARTFASLGEYVCSEENADFWLHMFVGGEITTKIGAEEVNIKIITEFPYYGRLKIRLDANDKMNGKFHLRIPSYAEHCKLFINGEAKKISTQNGYCTIPLLECTMEIELQFDMTAHFVYANPKVRADVGKTAVKKGPLVYCMEEIDNGANLSGIYVDTNQKLEEKYETDALGGTMLLTLHGKRIDEETWKDDSLYGAEKPNKKDTVITMVPYCFWGNRKKGEMQVWMKMLG